MPTGQPNPATYQGKVCVKCGSMTRYKANKRCVDCNRRYMLQHASTRTDREAMRGKPCVICLEAMEQPCFDEIDGRLRGWLCHHCNLGLGQFRENAVSLRLAAEYVETFARTGHEVTALDIELP